MKGVGTSRGRKRRKHGLLVGTLNDKKENIWEDLIVYTVANM